MMTIANDDKAKDIKFMDPNPALGKLIDEYDARALRYLADIYGAITGEKMDLDKVKNAVEALAEFNKKQGFCYLNNLLYPEKNKGVKIPSPIPVPSCAFQLHNSITLTSNDTGYFAGVFNPFYLGNANSLPKVFEYEYQGTQHTDTYDKSTSLWFNNSNSLTGSADNIHFRPVYIQQDIPNVYDQYRLVSASITLRYIGRLDIASGLVGGAIVFDENPNIGALGTNEAGQNINTLNPNLSKYGNFDLAQDSFYWQENNVIEGLRELYFPIDNSFEEYVKLNNSSVWDYQYTYVNYAQGVSQHVATVPPDYYRSGFNFVFYAWGVPPSSACFKMDIYCNFEALPNSQFLNYLPLSMNTMGLSSQEKRDANLIVQQQPIMKMSDAEKKIESVSVMPSIWDKMKAKFKDSLPGITKLIGMGLAQIAPKLKPGIALANALIDANSAMSIDK